MLAESIADYCDCPFCGVIEISGDRMSEGHVGIRFGDSSLDHVWHILLNGEPIEDRCFEAFAGEDGWALVMVEPIQKCSKGTHPCSRVELGTVEIRYSGPVIAPHV